MALSEELSDSTKHSVFNMPIFIYKEHSFIPIRKAVEFFGGSIVANEATGELRCTVGTQECRLTPYSQDMIINGIKTHFVLCPVVVNGILYAPAEIMTKAFGATYELKTTGSVKALALVNSSTASQLQFSYSLLFNHIDADLYGDGKSESIYLAFPDEMRMSNEEQEDRTRYRGELWIMKGAHEIFRRDHLFDIGNEFSIKTIDINNGRNNGLLLIAAKCGARIGEVRLFVYRWNGHQIVSALPPKDEIKTSDFGEAYLSNTKYGVSSLILVNGIVDYLHRSHAEGPSTYVADWYSWKGGYLIKTKHTVYARKALGNEANYQRILNKLGVSGINLNLIQSLPYW